MSTPPIQGLSLSEALIREKINWKRKNWKGKGTKEVKCGQGFKMHKNTKESGHTTIWQQCLKVMKNNLLERPQFPRVLYLSAGTFDFMKQKQNWLECSKIRSKIERPPIGHGIVHPIQRPDSGFDFRRQTWLKAHRVKSHFVHRSFDSSYPNSKRNCDNQ